MKRAWPKLQPKCPEMRKILPSLGNGTCLAASLPPFEDTVAVRDAIVGMKLLAAPPFRFFRQTALDVCVDAAPSDLS